jgi:hypothetical protein
VSTVGDLRVIEDPPGRDSAVPLHEASEFVLLTAILALVIHVLWFVHKATRQLRGEIAAAAVARSALDAEFPDRRPPTDPPTVQGRRNHLQLVKIRPSLGDVLRRLVSARQAVSVALVAGVAVAGVMLTADPISRHAPGTAPPVRPGAAYADSSSSSPAPAPKEGPAAQVVFEEPEKPKPTKAPAPEPTATPTPTPDPTVRSKRKEPAPTSTPPTVKPKPQPRRTVEPLPVPTIRIKTGCVQTLDVQVCVTR